MFTSIISSLMARFHIKGKDSKNDSVEAIYYSVILPVGSNFIFIANGTRKPKMASNIRKRRGNSSAFLLKGSESLDSVFVSYIQ